MNATHPGNAITSVPTSPQNIALAIGGLAGSNALGAGCLQSALENSLQPKLISCTSGQIFWVYSFLKAREAGERDIRARFRDYHQQEAPIFNMLHSLCRAIWHGPHTRLFWQLGGDDKVEQARSYGRKLSWPAR
jgi:hypothetical protein